MKQKIAVLLLTVVVLLVGAGILASCKHVCSFGEWETVKEATCTEKGQQQRVCLDPSCGKKETKDLEIDPANHNMEDINGVDAGCTTDGIIAHQHCLRCDKYFDTNGTEITLDQTVIHAHHTLTDVPAADAGCTQNGNVAYKFCSVCKKNFDDKGNELSAEEIFIAAGHKFKDIPANAATCTQNGNIAYKHCEACGKNVDGQGNELSADEIIIPASHAFEEVEGLPATLHADGIVAHKHCNVCGKDFGNDGSELLNVIIPAEHTDYDGETLYCATCDKYVIMNAVQFALFRDGVNGGNSYSGKTVVLDSDIDLENKEWTPIGNAKTAVFNGTFDGQGHTVYNLKVTGNNDGAGLFGFAPNSPSIGNFIVEGANISGCEYAGVAVANAYLTILHDITVKNVVINANHWVGGITGYSYANITNCHVYGLDAVCTPNLVGTSYDNGDKVGGIVGYFISGTLADCSVTDVTLKGYRDVGGLVGMIQKDGRTPVVSSSSVSNAKLIADQVTDFYGAKEMNIDEIAGRKSGEYSFADNTVEGVSYEYIVNNASAQTALDSAKSNSTVKLTAGEYDKLFVRQSKFVSVKTNEGSYPRYKREIFNLSILGVDGTVVKGIEFISGHIYSADNSVTDPVTGNKQNYYSNLQCADIAFRNIKFTDYMEFNGWESTLFSVDGLEISGCLFNMENSAKASTAGTIAAVHIGSSDGERNLKNFRFDSCEFLNAFQGIYVVNVENISVSNCKFENIKHNAIAMQSSVNGSTGGNITVENNTFSNGADRVVRFNNIGEDAVISIVDNVITDYSDTDGEIIKSGVFAVGAVLNFENNVYNQVVLDSQNIQGAGAAVVIKNS